MALKLRRGSDVERQAITPEAGEPIWVDNNTLYVGDGSTAGGIKITGDINADLATASIGALSDVDTSSVGHVPSDGDSLIWHDSMNHWMPGTPSLTLDDISNVNLTSNPPTTGQVLSWSGTEWVPQTALIGSTFDGDVTGSVFADDSSVLVDGVNNLLVGNIDSTTADIDTVNAGNATITDTLTVKVTDVQTINMAADTEEPLLKLTSETNTGTFGNPIISVNNHHAGTYSQEITFSRSAGTAASPTAASSGDYVGSLTFRVHDGDDFTSLAAMHVVADAVTGTDDVASKIDFYTRDGAIASEYEIALTLRHKGAEFTGYVQFGSYTTTERDALTAANGMVIYNTTDNKFQGYENGAWANLI